MCGPFFILVSFTTKENNCSCFNHSLKSKKNSLFLIENNIKLEQYTWRENLRFNNIEEIEGEDCKSVIHDIIKNDLGLDGGTVTGRHGVHMLQLTLLVRCGSLANF